ncbi:MAG: hypothetical protein WBF81_00840 [Thermoplasmata archaeon]
MTTGTSDTEAAGPVEDPRTALIRTLPLAVLTVVLFVGGYVAYRVAPLLGPANFPLFGLLFTLGFVAAVGTVLSWFFATDEPQPSGEVETARPAPSTDATPLSRAEFGRPPPEVVPPKVAAPISVDPVIPSVAAAPWDEDVLPPVTPRGPRPVLTTPNDPGDIGRALEEIAEIQRELASRRPSPAPRADSAARA